MQIALPPYAYVPGQTPRHAEDAFAHICDTVQDGMDAAALAASPAWAAGQKFFHAGFFWESHEVLEAVWMRTRPNSTERHLVQALIQTANAGLKARMQRPRAVLRLCDLAQSHLQAARAAGGAELMALRFDDLAQEIENLRQQAQRE